MKFVQTYNGDLINFDEVQRVVCENENSMIILKDGSSLDFFEIPDVISIDEEKIEIKPDTDHVLTLNILALKHISYSGKSIITLDEIEDDIWPRFFKIYKELQQTFVCNLNP